MPERTTYDYEGPGVDPRVQVTFDAISYDYTQWMELMGACDGCL